MNSIKNYKTLLKSSNRKTILDGGKSIEGIHFVKKRENESQEDFLIRKALFNKQQKTQQKKIRRLARDFIK